MVNPKNSMPASPPTISTSETANKPDAYTVLGEASNTLSFLDHLSMHASLYLT